MHDHPRRTPTRAASFFLLALGGAFQDPAPVAAPQEQPEAQPIERGLRLRDAGAFDGYTLFSPLLSGSSFLSDMDGEVVHRWDTGLALSAMAYLLDDGRLLRSIKLVENTRFFGGGLGGRLILLDWDGSIAWDWSLSNEQQTLHHDLELLPNGNILVIAWEYVSREDAIALGRDPSETGEKGWWPDAVLEVKPVLPAGAEIVWEWHARDHLVQDFDPAKPGYGSIAEHAGRIDVNADHRAEPPLTPERRAELEALEREMAALGYGGGGGGDEPDATDAPDAETERKPEPDWMHTNAVAHDPATDLIVLSSPHLNEIFVIDHSTTTEEARGERGGRRGRGGALLYRWGNPANYGAGARADQRLFGQHDPQWVPGAPAGTLRVTVFDNGSERPQGKWSSVLELALPFDAERGFLREPGRAFGPLEPAWTYVAPEPESFFSSFISGCQRLPNGNTLICSGAQGRFFEVTGEGRTVWEYWNPHGGEIEASFGNAAERKPTLEPVAVFRATRIAKDHPGLRGRIGADATAR